MQIPGRPQARAKPSAMYAAAFSPWVWMRLIEVRRSISASVLRKTAGTMKTCVTP